MRLSVVNYYGQIQFVRKLDLLIEDFQLKFSRLFFIVIIKSDFSDCDNLMSIVVPDGEQKKFRKMLHITVESDTLVLSE